jgi:hypothetical protein
MHLACSDDDRDHRCARGTLLVPLLGQRVRSLLCLVTAGDQLLVPKPRDERLLVL